MRKFLRETLICVVACCALLGATNLLPSYGVPPTTHQAPRVCFDRDEWGANAGFRPCARISRLYEDGSLKVRVSDANGTPRYSFGVGAQDR